MIPKFLVGDNSKHGEEVFIIHTQAPRFILNLETDELQWMDDNLPEVIGTDDEAEITTAIDKLLGEADDFYQAEIEHYESLEED